jgi:hypothetical protein
MKRLVDCYIKTGTGQSLRPWEHNEKKYEKSASIREHFLRTPDFQQRSEHNGSEVDTSDPCFLAQGSDYGWGARRPDDSSLRWWHSSEHIWKSKERDWEYITVYHGILQPHWFQLVIFIPSRRCYSLRGTTALTGTSRREYGSIAWFLVYLRSRWLTCCHNTFPTLIYLIDRALLMQDILHSSIFKANATCKIWVNYNKLKKQCSCNWISLFPVTIH